MNDNTPKADRITPHSFRRAAISRWTDLGIPRDVVKVIAGHKPQGVHDRYIVLTDQMLVSHFPREGIAAAAREKTANSSGRR